MPMTQELNDHFVKINYGSGFQLPTKTITATPYTVSKDESGTTFIIAVADCVVTLPSTAAGLFYRCYVKTLSTTTGAQISPAAADKIMVGGLTAVDNKDVINTAATDRVGDYIDLTGDGVDGWFADTFGTWAMEA